MPKTQGRHTQKDQNENLLLTLLYLLLFKIAVAKFETLKRK